MHKLSKPAHRLQQEDMQHVILFFLFIVCVRVSIIDTRHRKVLRRVEEKIPN